MARKNGMPGPHLLRHLWHVWRLVDDELLDELAAVLNDLGPRSLEASESLFEEETLEPDLDSSIDLWSDAEHEGVLQDQ